MAGWARFGRELEAALHRPVLRLPDIIEKARENPETFDVAVCSDLPDALVPSMNSIASSAQYSKGRPARKRQYMSSRAQEFRQALRSSFRSEPKFGLRLRHIIQRRKPRPG